MEKLFLGNSFDVGSDSKNWIMGHFKEQPMLHSEDVEIKYDPIKKGDHNESYAAQSEGSTFSLLVSGHMSYIFRVPSGTIMRSRGAHTIQYDEVYKTLEKNGDFLVWEAKVYHWWKAVEDSLVLTVRWPSKKGDVYQMPL